MTRTFKLPSTADERERLLAELVTMSTEVLGYATRPANLAAWRAMEIVELRRVHTKWREHMSRRQPAANN